MPRIWNTAIEDKRFPSDLRAEGPVVANTESDVLIEDAVKDVMRKPVLGQKLRLHPAFMSAVHDVCASCRPFDSYTFSTIVREASGSTCGSRVQRTAA